LGTAELNLSTTGDKITANQWAYIFIAHDSVNDLMILQVNANAAISQAMTATGLPNTNGKLYFGSRIDLVNFGGFMDEIGMWNKVLSVAERATRFGGGAGNTHPFDGGSVAGTDGIIGSGTYSGTNPVD